MIQDPQPQAASHTDLDRVISRARFTTFQHAAGDDDDLARELYVWDRDLSVAFLADLAVLEVALRNAMHEAAARRWGGHWYADPHVVLDERNCRQLSTTWSRLPKATRKRAADADLPGRVIAQCMFGFWTNLLDAGDHLGREPRQVRVSYESLWHEAFKGAFPGGREEARSQRASIQRDAPEGQEAATAAALDETVFVRSWVHGICKDVNDLRNRVAHHEPLINGFPLNGRDRRMSAAEAHEQCRVLARMIDRDLARWLDASTRVPTVLARRPTLACASPSN